MVAPAPRVCAQFRRNARSSSFSMATAAFQKFRERCAARSPPARASSRRSCASRFSPAKIDNAMSKSKAFFAGLLAGLIAGIAMTVVMLILALFGVATPLAIIGDRLSVFIKPGPFLALMGRVGGSNHLKQLRIGSTVLGQFIVSMLGGALFGLL